jgi:hypothetical protein
MFVTFFNFVMFILFSGAWLTLWLCLGCGNEQLLFHSTPHFNAYGVLGRGLMLPAFVVGKLQGRRTDAGRLGA